MKQATSRINHKTPRVNSVPKRSATLRNVKNQKSQKRHFVVNSTSKRSFSLDFKYVKGRNINILGVPFALGQGLDGVDTAPKHMRELSLLPRLSAQNWSVVDRGDVPISVSRENSVGVIKKDGMTLKYPDVVGPISQRIAEQCYENSKNGEFLINVGGDHSIAIGTVAGILKSRPESSVIWVDAHADINTPYTSPTGNIHGMPVAFLMKHPAVQNVAEFSWLKDYPALDPKKLVYIGLRDLDQGEKEIIREYGIKAFTMQDVDRLGIGKVMEQTIDYLTCGRRHDVPLHLSYDVDGIDPIYAPATGTRVAGGLSYREAYYITEALSETGCLSSMDLVEVNPALDSALEAGLKQCGTAQLAVGLCSSAVGERIL